MPVRALLLADGPGDLGPISELLEGVPWPVRAIVALVMATSPWWAPKLARQRRAKRTPTRARDRATAPSREQDETDEDPDSDELLDLRDSLIDVLQKLQAESRNATELARRLAEKNVVLEQERAESARMARNLQQSHEEIARLRQQVDALIERRERTPPHGQPTTVDSPPPPER